MPRLLLPSLCAALSLAAGCSEYDLNSKRVPNGDPPDTASDDTAPPVDLDCSAATAPTDYTVTTNEDCVAEPEVGTFSPTVEWQWSSSGLLPGYDQVMMTPAVANLTDDNGDGRIDADDTPEIVFTAYAHPRYTSAGALHVISGDGGGELWSLASAGGVSAYGCGGVAIGDVDGDRQPDVCFAGVEQAVVCVRGADGSLLWAAGSETSAYGAPALADLDADGDTEVIMGRQVFDHVGNLLWTGAGGTGSGVFLSFAVDWDNDGALEVVAGDTVYDTDGSVLASHTAGDGFTAAGDFDGDGRPDLVVVASATVTLLDNSLTTLWSTPIPGGGGGPPTIADFDGDGDPEVGVAGRDYYTVFETDGSVRWSQTTEDRSSSVTGSSVFDFEGDGDAEVVYADEHTLWVYDGSTGNVLMQETGHANGTLFEYPVIADVDADGDAEIVVASNNLGWAGWSGITVVGDADGSWAPARSIWNQHAYHITNINNDGTVPTFQLPNWATWNNFRAGGRSDAPGHWRPDLTPGTPEVCLDECDDGHVVIWLPVENEGLLTPPDPPSLLFRQGGPDGAPVRAEAAAVVPAGAGRYSARFDLSAAEWGADELWVVVDDDDLIEECDEDDNARSLGAWPCD
jgi:hypothetical protein